MSRNCLHFLSHFFPYQDPSLSGFCSLPSVCFSCARGVISPSCAAPPEMSCCLRGELSENNIYIAWSVTSHHVAQPSIRRKVTRRNFARCVAYRNQLIVCLKLHTFILTLKHLPESERERKVRLCFSFLFFPPISCAFSRNQLCVSKQAPVFRVVYHSS